MWAVKLCFNKILWLTQAVLYNGCETVVALKLCNFTAENVPKEVQMLLPLLTVAGIITSFG